MELVATIDRILGRARLDIVDGRAACPVRGRRVDVEACSSCPYWNRSEIDGDSHGVVVCRPSTRWSSHAAGTPPM